MIPFDLRTTRRFVALAAALLGIGGTGCGGMGSDPAAAPRAVPETEFAYDTATAVVRGRVTFDGTPPEPRPAFLATHSDPGCAEHSGKIPNPEVVVSEGRIANVLVYVDSAALEGYRYPRELADRASIDQIGCMYVPHVTAMLHGQTLEVANSDPTTHNVHWQTPGQVWNVSQAQGQPIEVRPGDYRYPVGKVAGAVLKCDKHSWMRAYVHVLYHPFFAVTGPDGAFELPPLPPGDYELVAWHERFGERRLAVSIAANETRAIEFAFAP